MSSTFFGLNISKTGLNIYQQNITTTAHNISNAETKGYSRQEVIQQASQALKVNNSYGMVGSGVDITSIDRVRNEYYDNKYRSNMAYCGCYSTQADYMSQIQNYYNEMDKDGFTTDFNEFYNVLVNMTSNPTDSVKKVQAINYAQSVAEYINTLSKQLVSVQDTANDDIKTTADRINSISDQILSLNKQIQGIEINGLKANDLRDQRDKLIDELSEFVNVRVDEKDVYVQSTKDLDGNPLKAGITSYSVYIDGQLLVDDLSANHLEAKPRENLVNESDVAGLYDLFWNGEDGVSFDLNSPTLSGKLRALTDIRDGNNDNAFAGKVDAAAVGATSIKFTGLNIKNFYELNIADEGTIQLDEKKYNYSDFKINFDSSGNMESVEFNLESGLEKATNGTSVATVGENVNYKGIPYYQGMLNEFVRTYAAEFNKIHNTGSDIEGNSGLDFFTAKQSTSNNNMVLGERADLAGTSITNSADSYYRLNARNFGVNSDIQKNPGLFYTATYNEMVNGSESRSVLDQIVALKNDNDMFDAGAPLDYLQSMTAQMAVNTSKAENFTKSMTSVIQTITNQRLSVSGVDSNEELAGLVKYQSGYNLCSKMISVFNQIYDKLINETGL